MDEVVFDVSDERGWERLALIVDIRRARDAGQIRLGDDGQVYVRDIPDDLRTRMARHRDLLAHALTYDKEMAEQRGRIRPPISSLRVGQ